MKNKELKSAVKQLLHHVSELNVRVTQLEYPPKVETQLLDGNKELVVGRWYKNNKVDGTFICLQVYNNNEISGYGVHMGIWGDWGMLNHEDYSEATTQEIESALIEGAKGRGHKYDVYSWNHEQNTLYGNRGNDAGHDILFENGVWSEVKPEEKPNVGDLVVMYDSRGEFTCIKRLTGLDKLNLEHCPDLVSYKLATKELVFSLLFSN